MAVRTKVEQLQLAGRGWLVLKPSPHRHLGVTSVDILDFGDTFCSDVITLRCFNESVGCKSGIRTLTALAAAPVLAVSTIHAASSPPSYSSDFRIRTT